MSEQFNKKKFYTYFINVQGMPCSMHLRRPDKTTTYRKKCHRILTKVVKVDLLFVLFPIYILLLIEKNVVYKAQAKSHLNVFLPISIS